MTLETGNESAAMQYPTHVFIKVENKCGSDQPTKRTKKLSKDTRIPSHEILACAFDTFLLVSVYKVKKGPVWAVVNI